MGKHLTLDDRAIIQQRLAEHLSLRQIASELNRSLSVVSREVRKHRKVCDCSPRYRVKNKCLNRKNCPKSGLCPDLPDCTKHCAACSKCNAQCPDFVEEHCPRLDVPPYVCNGCEDKHSCVLSKLVYTANTAQTDYDKLLRSARTGLNMTEEELDSLDTLVSPLLRNGQSINHVAVTQRDNLIRAPRTLYRLVHASVISARPIDMPRMCRLKPRRSGAAQHKVDRACRVGRTLCDFHDFIAQALDLPVVEMDSVIGSVGGKVLLTLHLTSFDFMIAILRDRNTAHSVADALCQLRETLSPALFAKIFPVLLTDNGSEFSDPTKIEFKDDDAHSTRVFYCDPQAAYQKPNVELNHEFIRRFLPKGASFDSLTQQDVSLMMSHINSYARGKFGWLSPAQLLIQAYGEETLRLLGQTLIPSKKIVLNGSIFRK